MQAHTCAPHAPMRSALECEMDRARVCCCSSGWPDGPLLLSLCVCRLASTIRGLQKDALQGERTHANDRCTDVNFVRALWCSSNATDRLPRPERCRAIAALLCSSLLALADTESLSIARLSRY